MNVEVELSRRTWNAAVKLALIISICAAVLAVAISAAGDVPQVAIVLPVIVVAFVASWIQTGRVRRDQVPVRVHHHHH
jgi:ABC-type Mn2+/Zn2+ transport system permease subunit